MTNIQKIVDLGFNNITLSVTVADLKEFALELIQECKSQNEVKDTPETYLTTKETARMLDCSMPTLWRWAKEGYLMPFKWGTKNRYRLSDVQRIKMGGIA